MQRGPEQLRHHGSRRRVVAGRHDPQGVEAHEPQPQPGVGEALADDRIADAAVARGPPRRTASHSFRNMRFWPRVEAPRSKASVPMATRHPPSTSPTTCSRAGAGAGEEHLVELGVAGELVDRDGCRRRPGASARAGTRCPCAWQRTGSVRASTKHQSAQWAWLVQTFWPSITHSPSTSSARVWMLARSEPAPGSLYPWHHSSVPATIPGRKRSRCASVPKAMSVGPSRVSPMWPMRPGARGPGVLLEVR